MIRVHHHVPPIPSSTARRLGRRLMAPVCLCPLPTSVIAIAMQPYLMKGRGRLRLPLHCDENALDSMRAAYSFLLLHQKGELVRN